MTIDEAYECIRKQTTVVRAGELDRVNFWYTISRLSDDESTAYIKLRGMGWSSALVKDLEVDR